MKFSDFNIPFGEFDEYQYRTFFSPQKIPMTLFPVNIPTVCPSKSNHWSYFCCHRLFSFVYSGISCKLTCTFCILLFSLSLIVLRPSTLFGLSVHSTFYGQYFLKTGKKQADRFWVFWHILLLKSWQQTCSHNGRSKITSNIHIKWQYS